ncbi:actin-binding protein wsp1-like [Miscanthus floridulus]|uniref:actin-binding protein wsp1-like n=1 Tax=Miscanthus floridulus TaxID=154761 RepID=UPI00345A3715
MTEAGPDSLPPRRAPRLGPAQPSPASRLACLHARLPADAPRRARPRHSSPTAWRPCAVDAAVRRSRPAPAPTRPPTSAGAGALACSLPRCLSSPQAPRALPLPLAAPPHPPAKSATAPPPRPAFVRPQLHLALRQVVLAPVPPAEPR